MNRAASVLERESFARLFEALHDRGYEVIGPRVSDGAIVYEAVGSVEDLPEGWIDEQAGGTCRLVKHGDELLFGFTLGPLAWKRVLHPPTAPLFEGSKVSGQLRIQGSIEDAPRVALLGVRACELEAIRIHTQRAFPRKGIAEEQSCETCHGPGSLHAESGSDRAGPGFDTIWGPTTNPKALGEACWKCHESTHPLFQASVHAQRGYTCTACHSTHAALKPGTDQGHLLKKDSVNETCFNCHRDKKAHVSRVAHMPIREGKVTCVDCHQPHGSPHARSLAFASVNELCVSCHEEKRGPFLWEHPRSATIA